MERSIILAQAHHLLDHQQQPAKKETERMELDYLDENDTNTNDDYDYKEISDDDVEDGEDQEGDDSTNIDVHHSSDGSDPDQNLTTKKICDPTLNQCMAWCGEIVRREGYCPNGMMCCALI
ncbi:hypothetical protein QR98_0040650 [Sarcoptes scabiei]|nr:hypothetical protein QR98_0040650 [Sarcoptes scabiei]